MKKIIATFNIFFLLACSFLVWAGQGTFHKDHDNSKASDQGKMQRNTPPGTYERQVVVGGVRAEFQIMSLASMNMKDPNGATHHVMVKLFHDSANHPIKDAVGKVKVIEPNGNFSFKKTGKYGVICLVKVGEEKYLFKFWYHHG